MSPWFAMVLASTLQPWALIGAGAATVVEAKLSSWESFLALVGFCVLASASYLAMEIYAGLKPDKSQALLARFRTWIGAHAQPVIIWEPDRRSLARSRQHLPDRQLRVPEINEHRLQPANAATANANVCPVSSEANAAVCALPLFIPSGRFALPLSAAEWGVMQETVPHPHEVIQPPERKPPNPGGRPSCGEGGRCDHR